MHDAVVAHTLTEGPVDQERVLLKSLHAKNIEESTDRGSVALE